MTVIEVQVKEEHITQADRWAAEIEGTNYKPSRLCPVALAVLEVMRIDPLLNLDQPEWKAVWAACNAVGVRGQEFTGLGISRFISWYDGWRHDKGTPPLPRFTLHLDPEEQEQG